MFSQAPSPTSRAGAALRGERLTASRRGTGGRGRGSNRGLGVCEGLEEDLLCDDCSLTIFEVKTCVLSKKMTEIMKLRIIGILEDCGQGLY